jgi:hypothetical protein
MTDYEIFFILFIFTLLLSLIFIHLCSLLTAPRRWKKWDKKIHKKIFPSLFDEKHSDNEWWRRRGVSSLRKIFNLRWTERMLRILLLTSEWTSILSTRAGSLLKASVKQWRRIKDCGCLKIILLEKLRNEK